TLVSFGGAGGLHVAELAAALRIPRILIPRSPGTLSALGVLLGDVVKHHSRTVMLKVSGLDLTFVDREFKKLEGTALRDLTREGFSAERIKLNRTAAMRYVGQSFEIDVAFGFTRGATFESIFHGLHRERYGYSDPGRPTEIVSLKVRAAGITEKPKLARHGKRSAGATAPAFIAQVFLNGRRRQTPVHQREDISPGAAINGPAIILEYSSTTLVASGLKAQVDPWLNLVID
ncbi:MAG: hydantoinase/oxoprolinase family protein, partial [Blastocatellia bacterium]